ncbi:class I adenylate-forming enzyme family protein [Streptomyces sp. NPDC048514]|uniref:class I adenylate-forming enzyme family protein n=1 Tax=Streptomyces sp. NPDC048514 TaxID=3365564 RepID=UPI00371585FA
MTVLPDPNRHVLIAADAETGERRQLDANTLRELVRATVARLRDRAPGMRPGSLLAIAVRNSVQAVVLQLAAEELGLVPFPTAPRGDLGALRDAVGAAGASVLAHLTPGPAPSLAIEEVERPRASALTADTDGSQQAPARSAAWGLAINTSGSTGSAKTVLLDRAALARNARDFGARTRLGPGSRYLVTAPLWHVGGSVVGMRAALSCGAVLILPPEAKSGVLASWLRDCRPTHLAGVPTVLFDLLDHGSAGTGWPQHLITGGMAVERSLIGSLHALGSRVTILYGMTEFTNAVMSADVPAGSLPPTGFVGRPFPGVRCRVDGPDGRLLVRGYPRAAAVVQDGVVRPLPTDADGWYETGDLARQTPDGYVIVGRSRDVVIRGGVNISGTMLVEAARRTLLAKEAVVQALPSARLGEDIALIVYGPTAEECRRRGQDFLARLPHGTRPGFLVVSGSPLPRTANDKHDLARIRRATAGLAEAVVGQASGLPIHSIERWS